MDEESSRKMPDENAIVVLGTSAPEIRSLVPFAQAFADDQDCPLIILGLVPVPLDQSLSAGALAASRLRKSLIGQGRLSSARVVIRVAHDLWREARELVTQEHASLAVLNWKRQPARDWMSRVGCDIAFVKPPFPSKMPRILLPIRGGPYAALALRFALALAKASRGEITVLHASRMEEPADYFGSFLQRLTRLDMVTRWVSARGDPIGSIIQAARNHQLIVMGAAASIPPDDPPLGRIAQTMLDAQQIPSVVVKAAHPLYSFPLPEPKPQPVDYTISVIVDKWFAENTFHAHEFEDLAHLVRLKEKQNLTISLGLPTLNEEKTIGKIIRTMRARFIKGLPLLDEIVVIDSNSTDRTVQIAQDMGVAVVKHPEVLNQYEKWSGKGEALWNSLYILKGDLIAWIDTDIVNIHPRFVYGILGPLIRESHLMYVKGFYQRPIRSAGKLQARGGGRVTELTARPLLNLFYPELSGIVQPLSGEYAGRRTALENVPFFAGYGVEIGLLIDIWSKYGLDAIGQVDLEKRIHRNQSITALSKMAFEIVQVVMLRVGQARGVELMNELNKSMKLIRYARDDFQLDVADIRARERPPMISVPEYRARHRVP